MIPNIILRDVTMEQKQRDTKQRHLTYDAVMSRCDHPTVDELYFQIHETDSRVSKGTVYRNLNVLVQTKQIMLVRVPGADRYDSRLDRHYHLICMNCGKVVDSPIPYRPEYDMDMEKATGFQIQRHRMIFEGLCADCTAKEKNTYRQTGTAET